ncbi:hypothetical protein M885DRAFT_627044, partial [Pelagophyceae sp. CCMP2097]
EPAARRRRRAAAERRNVDKLEAFAGDVARAAARRRARGNGGAGAGAVPLFARQSDGQPPPRWPPVAAAAPAARPAARSHSKLPASQRKRSAPAPAAGCACASCGGGRRNCCGVCNYCLDKTRFGGPSKLRRACRDPLPCFASLPGQEFTRGSSRWRVRDIVLDEATSHVDVVYCDADAPEPSTARCQTSSLKDLLSAGLIRDEASDA